MTAGIPAGAVAHREVDWCAIDWRAVHCEVRRLQARIVMKGLSCIKRKFYVQFLGGGEAVMPPCYPATGVRKGHQGGRAGRFTTFTTVCPCRCGMVKPLPTPTLQVEERSITLRRETGHQTSECKGEKGMSC